VPQKLTAYDPDHPCGGKGGSGDENDDGPDQGGVFVWTMVVRL
jgi:hypothetical protein